MATRAKATGKVPMPQKRRSTSFKPGNNANPLGPPVKEWRVSTWIKKELEKEDYEAKVLNAQLIAQNLVNRAKANDEQALAHMKEVMDRSEGKAGQSVDMTTNGKDITPVLVRFIGEHDN